MGLVAQKNWGRATGCGSDLFGSLKPHFVETKLRPTVRQALARVHREIVQISKENSILALRLMNSGDEMRESHNA